MITGPCKILGCNRPVRLPCRGPWLCRLHKRIEALRRKA